MKRHLIFGFILIAGCVSKTDPSAEALRWQAKLNEQKKDMTALEDKIKEADGDPGLKNRLAEDKELLKSRMERVKEHLKIEGVPDTPEKEAAAH